MDAISKHIKHARQSIKAIWFSVNTSFRHIFHSCWRESVKTLQYFCQLLPMSYLIDQRRLLFWQKMIISYNAVLLTLIFNQFMAVGSRYGITSFSISPYMPTIRFKIWDSLASSQMFSHEVHGSV